MSEVDKYIDISILAEKFIPDNTDILRVQNGVKTYKIPLSEIFRRIISGGTVTTDNVTNTTLQTNNGVVNQDMSVTGNLLLEGMKNPTTILSPEFTTVGQIWFAPAGMIRSIPYSQIYQGVNTVKSIVASEVTSPFTDVAGLAAFNNVVYSDGTNIKFECTSILTPPYPLPDIWNRIVVEKLA